MHGAPFRNSSIGGERVSFRFRADAVWVSSPIPPPSSSPSWLESLLAYSSTQEELPRSGEGEHGAPLYVQGKDSSGSPAWLCLACLGQGKAEGQSVALGVAAHLESCSLDFVLARCRMDLLEIISAVSEAEFAAGWLTGIQDKLIVRGGVWVLLADAVGWPIGYLGLDGWEKDAASALARRATNRQPREGE